MAGGVKEGGSGGTDVKTRGSRERKRRKGFAGSGGREEAERGDGRRKLRRPDERNKEKKKNPEFAAFITRLREGAEPGPDCPRISQKFHLCRAEGGEAIRIKSPGDYYLLGDVLGKRESWDKLPLPENVLSEQWKKC